MTHKMATIIDVGVEVDVGRALRRSSDGSVPDRHVGAIHKKEEPSVAPASSRTHQTSVVMQSEADFFLVRSYLKKIQALPYELGP
jgi:hypothetical protein